MRFFFFIQVFILCLGMLLWQTAQFCGKLPDFVCPLFFGLKNIKAEQISYDGYALYISQMKGQAGKIRWSAKQAKVSGNLFLGEQVISIQDGRLTWGEEKFEEICGIVHKKGRQYKGFLSAKHEKLGAIQIACQDFIDLQKQKLSTENLQGTVVDMTSEQINLVVSIFNQAIRLQYEIKNICNGITQIEKLAGSTMVNRFKAWTILHGLQGHYKDVRSPFFTLKFNNKIKKGTFASTKSFSCYGRFSCLDIKDCDSLLRIPTLYKIKSSRFFLAVDSPWMKGSGHGNFTFSKKKWQVKKGFLQIYPDGLPSLQKEFLAPYAIKLKTPVYLFHRGDFKNFSTQIFTPQITFQEESFQICHAQTKNKKDKDLSWNISLSQEGNRIHNHGHWDTLTNKGRCFFRGKIPLQLTCRFRDNLPVWWESFFSPFIFHKGAPYVDVDFQWDTQNNQQTFGYASAKQCDYKRTFIEDLKVVYGNLPGYCEINIENLKTKGGRGKCSIQWSYDLENQHLEAWLFKGQGAFPIKTWKSILDDFIGDLDLHHFDLFSPNSIGKFEFSGKIHALEEKQNYIHLNAHFDKTLFYQFPIQHLSFNYSWHPYARQVKAIQGQLFDTAPVSAEVYFKEKEFNLDFSGQGIPSQLLLDHPLFLTWSKDIPEENRASYCGQLDTKIKAQGTWGEKLTVKGEGAVDFKNPNLSEVHLLGPLSHLFTRKKRRPLAIQLNQFISHFTFNEKQISSDDIKILGPSTTATLGGTLDLEDRTLHAKAHFSFLDKSQLKFPILQHAVQILQPVTQGFSATIHGSFKNPKCDITFNPLRFIFPQKEKLRK